MAEPIRVVLIEDDEPVRESLRLFLEMKGMQVVSYETADAFLPTLDGELMPDCIVTDVRLPGRSGLDLQRELKDRKLLAPMILITGHGDIDMAVAAIKAGAHDFIEKPFDEMRLVESVRAAVADAAEQHVAAEQISSFAARVATLSDRQSQVMDLAVKGLSNKEIAQQLGISPRTVEIYRAWVMEKTGARNLAELVRFAVLLERTELK